MPSFPAFSRRSAPSVAIVTALALWMGPHSPPRHGYLEELALLVDGARGGAGPRISVSPDRALSAGSVPAGELLAYAGRVDSAFRAGGGAEPMHAAALLALVWADSTAASTTRIDSAIGRLEGALRVGGPSARVLGDLAAAHLLRADRPRSEAHLLRALDAADTARALDPTNRAARYNLGLALERLGLDAEARREWGALRDRERGTIRSPWAASGPRVLNAAPRPPPRTYGVRERWAMLAARDPQRARMTAMDTLLGEWGRAVLDGDTGTATERLRSVEGIADGLARRGGDPSVHEMVRAIHAAERRSAVEVRRLALAHFTYAAAQEQVDRRVNNDSAATGFLRAREEAGASPVLALWATHSRGVALYYHQGTARYAQRVDSARALFREIVESTDATRLPVLSARARWSLGTLALLGGAPAAARDYFVAAAPLFALAGEGENVGAVQGLESEASFTLGDDDAAFAAMVRALHTLRRHPYSVPRHNLLYVTSQAAAARGMGRAGLRLVDINVRATSRVPRRLHAEALLLRARALAERGDLRGSAEDVSAGRRVVESMGAGAERDWYGTDLRIAEAGLLVRADPDSAAVLLDSAVSFFATRGASTRLLRALVQLADARLGSGDTSRAVVDLDSAAAVLGKLGKSVEAAAMRARMLEAARGVFDRLAMLHARSGRVPEALGALERGRAAFAPIRGRRGAAAVSARGPPGATVVDYALIGDTLLTFTLTRGEPRLRIDTLRRETLRQRVAALRSALEVKLPADSVRQPLERLYDVLIRPIRRQLAPGAPLVIVADGELAAVPFAALRDRSSRRYLVEDHSIRYASTLEETRRAHPAAPRAGKAVFVTDPAISPGSEPGLARLPRLAATARAIARSYPGAALLEDTAASPDAVRAALRNATLFHFSGHAVFDDDRPGHSYLVLAPGRGTSGRVSADEIAGMELRGLRLAVLSACETQPSLSGRAGGFAGLSGAMLAGGAGGVLGSLWPVRERPTGALMTAFHRAYASSGDGPAALRGAQLALIRSPDPSLSTPAAWAAFRYSGQ